MFRNCIIELLLLVAATANAQTLPTEKLFFATDKISYGLTDTIRVNGRLIRADSDASESPYSRFVYLEILNNEDSICSRQRIVVDEKGRFSASKPIDALLGEGIYYMRAFSKMMCNFEDATIPSFPIEISKDGYRASASNTNGIHCEFFPQGGHLVANALQNISVSISDGNEKPLAATIKLFTDKGDTLQTRNTTSAGWTMLSLAPQTDTHYYILIRNNDGEWMMTLPEVETDAVTMSTSLNRRRLNYNILGQIPRDSKLYSYHQSTGLLLLKAEQRGSIDVEGINNGVLSLILTDKDEKILSEVHTWLGKRTQVAPELPSLTFTSCSNLDFNLYFASMTDDYVSVRFIPYEEAVSSVLSSWIPTSESLMNYESDLYSPQPFPQNLCSESISERMTDINAWLCSAQFSRLNIAKAVNEGLNFRYKPEQNHVISGRIYGEDKRWKLHGGSVIAYQHSNGETFTAEVDKKGFFHLPVGDYADGESFFLQAQDEKGKVYVFDYEIFNDTIPLVKHIRHVHDFDVVETKHNSNNRFSFDGTNLISEVVVKGRMKPKEVKSEKEFYGVRFLSEEKMEERQFQSFQELINHFSAFMYLMPVGDEDDKAPERQARDSWQLFPRRVSILTGKAEIPIYIDNTRVSTDEAFYTNMNDIATAEYLSHHDALARYPNSINGVLELTTKKYRGPKEIKSKGISYGPPFGISNLEEAAYQHLTSTPTVPGEYLMIVDCVDNNASGNSFAYKVTVE